MSITTARPTASFSLVPELIDKISGLFKKDKDGKKEEKEAEIKLDDPEV